MRSHPTTHRFIFRLPLGAAAISDFRRPGVEVEIGREVIAISGPSRESVFEAAAGLLRAACRGLKPLSIAGRLYVMNDRPTDGRDWLLLPGSSDGWTIIVGADVAFSPTGVDPHLPATLPTTA